MDVSQIHGLCYSATGVTEKVVRTLADELEKALGLAPQGIFHGFRKPLERAADYTFGPGDLVVVGTPTYAGRVPNKILPDFQARLHGNGALAVPVVAFGNRAYDNALAELCALLEAQGFHTLAAGAFVGRHAFTDRLAEGRPDWDDRREMQEFCGIRTAEYFRKFVVKPMVENEMIELTIPDKPNSRYQKYVKNQKLIEENDGGTSENYWVGNDCKE